MRRLFGAMMFNIVASVSAWSAGAHDPTLLVPMDRKMLQTELSDSRGQVLLVNLWATWCTPCLREIPDLLALETDFPSAEFRLLAISMDDSYSQEWVTEFKAQHFPTLVSFINAEPDMDLLVSVIDPVWNETLPTSYIFGRDGELVQKIQGKKPKAYFQEQLIAAGLKP